MNGTKSFNNENIVYNHKNYIRNPDMFLFDRKMNNSEGSKDKFRMAAHVLSSKQLNLVVGRGRGGGRRKKVVVRFVTGSKVNTINNLPSASFLKSDTFQITE